MTESYGRAYRNMVSAQNIADMEEIVEYLKVEDDISKSTLIHPANHPSLDDKRSKMLSVWRRRPVGCHEHVEVYDTILSIRSFVLRPEEAIDEKLHLLLFGATRSTQQIRRAPADRAARRA
jgi:serine/threonine-protein kinase mTOR